MFESLAGIVMATKIHFSQSKVNITKFAADMIMNTVEKYIKQMQM